MMAGRSARPRRPLHYPSFISAPAPESAGPRAPPAPRPCRLTSSLCVPSTSLFNNKSSSKPHLDIWPQICTMFDDLNLFYMFCCFMCRCGTKLQETQSNAAWCFNGELGDMDRPTQSELNSNPTSDESIVVNDIQ